MFLVGNGPAASRHVKTIEVRKFLLGSNFQWRHVPIDGLLKLVVSNLCIPTMSDWHQLTPIDINWHQLTLEFSLGAWKHQPHQADAQSDVSDWELQTQCRAFDQHFSRCGCQVSTVGVVPDWSQCLEKANKKCTSKKSLNVVFECSVNDIKMV